MKRVSHSVADEHDQGNDLDGPDGPTHEHRDEEEEPTHDSASSEDNERGEDAIMGEHRHAQKCEDDHKHQRHDRARDQLALRLGADPQRRCVPGVPRELRCVGIVAVQVGVPPGLVLHRQLRGRVLVEVDSEGHIGCFHLAFADPQELAGSMQPDELSLCERHHLRVKLAGENRKAHVFGRDIPAEAVNPAFRFSHTQLLWQLHAERIQVALCPGLPHLVPLIEAPRGFQIHLAQKRRLPCHHKSEGHLH
mmetsp:Transcript_94140/g.262026  ORF Transcript_94140/g.262026 Transcript_94140/m.262026 type:complete len:250 (-) Transcript_94140:1337-2086(-)